MPWKFDCPKCEKEILLENRNELVIQAHSHCAGKHSELSDDDIEKRIERIERGSK